MWTSVKRATERTRTLMHGSLTQWMLTQVGYGGKKGGGRERRRMEGAREKGRGGRERESGRDGVEDRREKKGNGCYMCALIVTT